MYNRTTSFPVTLDERLRNAFICDYLIGRRLRVAAEKTHQLVIAAEHERLADFAVTIGDCCHMYTRTWRVERSTCFVCGIDEEHHDHEMQGRPYPRGASYAREAGSYEQHLHTEWKVERALGGATIESAQHMRHVLRDGEW